MFLLLKKVEHMTTKTVSFMLMLSVFFAGCATMTPQETQPAPVGGVSQTSKTIEAARPEEPAGLKRKVAIGRFSNETRFGQSFFLDEDKDRIGKQAMDILSAKLFETGRFIMLERADLAKIEKELEIGGAPSLRNAADYLILGSITEFGRKETSDVGLFSRVRKQEAFAKVYIRLVDVSTGQIIYSEEGQGSAYSEAGSVFGVGAKSAYDGQLNDKAIDAAISDLASNVIENMLDKPWHGYILGYEDGSLITTGGKSQNIKVGDEFEVMQEGKKINNPQTNMMMTLPGKKVAAIRITAMLGDTPENEVSLAEVTEGDLSEFIQSGDLSKLFIQSSKEER
jgi:curli biogenesis system outer membrane secretion channel CsgG